MVPIVLAELELQPPARPSFRRVSPWRARASAVTASALSAGLTRLLTGMLFEVRPLDPLVLGSVSLLLAGVALLASYLPARRAARIDPISALRCD